MQENENENKNESENEEEEEEEEEERPRRARSTSRPRGRGRSSRQQTDQGWSGYQTITDENEAVDALVAKQTSQRYNHLKNKIILDTGSTIKATIMNPDFVMNIRKSDTLLLMTTNAETMKMDLDEDVKGFGIAKYDPNQIANIFGFSHMADMCRITYDSSVEDAFNIHTTNGIVKFVRDG